MSNHYEIYKDATGQYRWRYWAGNGRKIADSGESYFNKADCQRGIEIMKASANSPVEDSTVSRGVPNRY
jgi:uncharacterized protein